MLGKFEQFLNYENIFKILGMDWKDPVCLLVLFVCYEFDDVKCGINNNNIGNKILLVFTVTPAHRK